MATPKGITILAILSLVSGILFAIAAVVIMIGIPTLIDQPYMAMATGGLLALSGILAIVSLAIGFALFAGKKWSRTVVIISSIIGLGLEIISTTMGDFSSLVGIALNIVILWYMWRPHVIAYFEAR